MNTLVPNPLFDYAQLFSLLLPIASLLVAAGLLGAFQRAASGPEQLRAIVQVAAVVALLAYFDLAVQTGKKCVQTLVQDGMHARPEELPQKFAKKLLATNGQDEGGGLWDQVTRFATRIFEGFLIAFIVLVALVALAVFYLAYLAQELTLEMGIGLAPLFVGFLLLPATRGLGVQFLLYMLAVILFPVGWGAASLVSDRLIEFSTAHNLDQIPDVAASLSFGIRSLFGTLVLAVWIIVSTLVAPFAMLKAVTTGVPLSSDAFRGVQAALRSK